MSKLARYKIKGMDVYRNGEYLGFIKGQSKALRKDIVRSLVLHTHIGEWINADNGITYATTAGVYLLFQKCTRSSDCLIQSLQYKPRRVGNE